MISKCAELKKKLKDKTEVIKAGIFASSPDEVKALSQKIIEEEVNNSSLSISINGLKKIVDSYEANLTSFLKNQLNLQDFKEKVNRLKSFMNLLKKNTRKH